MRDPTQPDPTLHGNGTPRPACELRREEAAARKWAGPGKVECNHCNGLGRIPRPIEAIYADQLAEAHKHYWSWKTYEQPTEG